MRITVTDGAVTKTADFREGSRVSDIAAALGFGLDMPCGGTGRCGKCRCKVDGREELACRTQLFSDAVVELSSPEALVLTASECVEDVDGVAIDIGTTTVAAALFRNGRPVRTIGRKNPQCAYGADVISRIGAKNTAPLTAAIQGLIREIRRELGRDENTVITGNTAMLSLLCGMDVSKMGGWPFPMPSAFDTDFEGAWLPPCVSAFIGADALCSMLRAGEREGTLMLDLGTNGEIGIFNGGEYAFTSAAAGPALEGANISRGMAAGPGAINRVDGRGCQVIGGGRALGLCGSGLVDTIALMLERGALDSFGSMIRDFEIYDSGVAVTQADVRNFQLCKAALATGLKILLLRRGLSLDQVSRVCLSGALGQSLNIHSAIRTGLLPQLDIDKFVSLGNGALMGGAMLLKEENRRLIRSIALNCTCIDLVADPKFTELYMNEINFRI